MLNREKVKLSDQHRGIKDMRKPPDAVVVVDSQYEATAIKEATSMNIPTVAIVDSNTDPNKIDFNGTEFITSIENQDTFKASLKSWYKIKFKEIAIPRLNYFSDKYNLKINQVRFKNQKTLWGSCSSKNNINLNYLLVMAPMLVIDYVIIHELVHTVHKNHSENFWNAVEAIMPDYKKAKKWLNKNGYKLRNL